MAALGLILVPVAAISAGEFTDVANDRVFKADIAWLADSGVTTGAHTVSQESVAGVTSGTSERG